MLFVSPLRSTTFKCNSRFRHKTKNWLMMMACVLISAAMYLPLLFYRTQTGLCHKFFKPTLLSIQLSSYIFEEETKSLINCSFALVLTELPNCAP